MRIRSLGAQNQDQDFQWVSKSVSQTLAALLANSAQQSWLVPFSPLRLFLFYTGFLEHVKKNNKVYRCCSPLFMTVYSVAFISSTQSRCDGASRHAVVRAAAAHLVNEGGPLPLFAVSGKVVKWQLIVAWNAFKEAVLKRQYLWKTGFKMAWSCVEDFQWKTTQSCTEMECGKESETGQWWWNCRRWVFLGTKHRPNREREFGGSVWLQPCVPTRMSKLVSYLLLQPWVSRLVAWARIGNLLVSWRRWMVAGWTRLWLDNLPVL